MTLCLSAICDSGQALACVFDEQWTTALTAAEGLTKGARINDKWLMFYAGDDIRHVGTVFDRVKRELLTATGVSLQKVQVVVQGVCDDVLNEELAHGLLRPLGVTPAQFVQNSHGLVSDEKHREELWDRITAARLGSDFLLAGFDDRDLPHIVALTDDGRAYNFDRRGFGAIGSGEAIASHYLAAIGYTRHLPGKTAVYAVSAAKFVAESGFVGPATHVAVLRREGGPLLLTDTATVRALWEKHSRPRLPVGIEALMPPFKLLLKPAPRPVATPTLKSPKRGRTRRQP